MKNEKFMKMKLQLLIVLFVFAAAVSAQTVDVGKMPTLKVTGTAEIQVVPDTATFSFVVSKKNKSVAVAKKENDETIVKVTALAKQFGVAAADVKTDYIRVSEATKRVRIPDSDDDYENVPDGYFVNRSLVIRLRDMTKFESFLTALIDAGVTNVNNVVFSSSEIRKFMDQARAQAIRAAKEKAQAIAGEIGQTIGKAVSIEEEIIDKNANRYSNASSNSNTFIIDGAEVADSSAVGTITVKAQVEAEFLLN